MPLFHDSPEPPRCANWRTCKGFACNGSKWCKYCQEAEQGKHTVNYIVINQPTSKGKKK